MGSADDFDFDIAEDFGGDDDFNDVGIQEGNKPAGQKPQVSLNNATSGPSNRLRIINRDEDNDNLSHSGNHPSGGENEPETGNAESFDDEDELLSQIDDNGIFESSQNSNNQKSPVQKETISSVHSSERELINPHASNNSKHSVMGPPTTPVVSKRLTGSTVSTPKSQESSSSGYKTQGSDVSSATSTSTTSSVKTSSSREVFFANWDSDELSSYEKRLQATKRRFPGPAGLLPEISLNEIRLLNNTEHPLTQQISKIINCDLLQLQAESKSLELSHHTKERDIFRITKAPWRELLKILNINPKEPNGLLHFMNIRWVRRKVSKHPVTTKIPFLALVVQDEPEIVGSKRKMGNRPKNPSIKVMDPSGTISAVMDGNFVEMYGSELSSGTAIAVRNCGFLRFKRQVVLTITRKNVICMTTMKKTEVPSDQRQINIFSKPSKALLESTNEVPPTISETEEGVRVLQFKDFSPSKKIELMEEYKKILNTNLDEDTDGGTSPKQPRLFSGIEESPGRPSFNNNNNNNTSRVINNPVQPGTRNASTAHSESNWSMDLSAFCDDDDDELMQALKDVDF